MKVEIPRERCARCNRLTRPKNRKHHGRCTDEVGTPFCSFHCKTWYPIELARRAGDEARER